MKRKNNKKQLIKIGKSVLKINNLADKLLPILISSLVTIISIIVSVTIFLQSIKEIPTFPESSTGLYKQFFIFSFTLVWIDLVLSLITFAFEKSYKRVIFFTFSIILFVVVILLLGWYVYSSLS